MHTALGRPFAPAVMFQRSIVWVPMPVGKDVEPNEMEDQLSVVNKTTHRCLWQPDGDKSVGQSARFIRLA